MNGFVKSSIIGIIMLWLSGGATLRAGGPLLKTDDTPLEISVKTLQTSLTHLCSSLTMLQTTLSKIFPSPDELEIKLPLDQRKRYIAREDSWQRYPIRFYKSDVLNKKTYLAQHNDIDPKNCHVIVGPFTYYNAIPPETKNPKSIHDTSSQKSFYHDRSWGCAWRASLNVLNSVKEWLENEKGIVTKTEALRNRQLNMDDIQKWTNLSWNDWIEPAENAELFLCFIHDWYSDQDQEKIKKIVDFRGHLYLTENTSDAKNTLLEHSFRYKKVALKKLNATLALPSNTSHSDTLKKFYETCGESSAVSPLIFPQFDDKTHPFPLNVDDGTCARNIYGFHTKNDTITHLFIGEVHIWNDKDSPWLESGWKSIETIFEGKNIMIFEVFLKESK
ncbi:MAG: hypothetical protein V1855_02000 [bacterium]